MEIEVIKKTIEMQKMEVKFPIFSYFQDTDEMTEQLIKIEKDYFNSIPITIVIIAYEQALNDVEVIRYYFKLSNKTKK